MHRIVSPLRRIAAALFVALAPAALQLAAAPEGSPEWIAQFIDRSGGCVTLLNTMPALRDGRVPNMVCPACLKEGVLKWRPEAPDELTCTGCGRRITEAAFPASGKLSFDGMDFEFYQAPGNPQKFFLKPNLRYIKSLYAMTRARDLARLGKTKKDHESAARALAIMTAYADYYRQYICNVAGNQPYRPGWPRQCNWGRITHFGDYVFPKNFCSLYSDLASSDLSITPAQRAACRSLLETMISEVTLPFIRQVGGMGNPMGAAYADCIAAGRLFPEGRFIDYYTSGPDGKPRVLNGSDLVHEMIEGRHGLDNLLANYYYADGLMRERTVAYHEMLARGIRNTAQAIKGYSDPAGYDAAARGYTPFRQCDLLARPDLAAIFTRHQAVNFPDGRSIPVGDDYGDEVSKTPEQASCFYPGWGMGVLRLGKAGQISAAVLNFGSGLDGHSHNDMLSLLLWSNDLLMLNPTEYPAHRDGAIREEYWRGGAAAHNTALIDGVNHTRGRGNPALWAVSPAAGIVQAFADGAYPDKPGALRRTVFLIDSRPGRPPYLVDLFQVRGGAAHDYFLQAQNAKYGPPETVAVTAPKLVPTGKATLADYLGGKPDAAYTYIAAPEAGPLAATAEINWRFPGKDGEKGLRALIVPESGNTQLIRGRAPGVRHRNETDQTRTVDKFAVRRTGVAPLASSFLAVFEPLAAGVQPDIAEAVRLPAAGQAVSAARINRGGGFDLVIVNSGGGEAQVRDGDRLIRFDGKAAVLSFDAAAGEYRLTAAGGSTFHFGDLAIKCAGDIRGKLVSPPGGLAAKLAEERAATVETDCAVPADRAGRMLLVKTANGQTSGWLVTAVEALPMGGSRLTFDRSARIALPVVSAISADGLEFASSSVSRILPGDRARLGGEWRKIVKVTPPADGSKFNPKPSSDRYDLPDGNSRYRLDAPVKPGTVKVGDRIPVSEIAAGDEFTLDGITVQTFAAERAR